MQGSGFRVQGSGFRVQGVGLRVQGSGCMVQGSGFRVQGSGCRVQGAGCRGQDIKDGVLTSSYSSSPSAWLANRGAGRRSASLTMLRISASAAALSEASCGWGARCRVQGAGFRVQGAGCRVQGLGCRVPTRLNTRSPRSLKFAGLRSVTTKIFLE